MKRLALLCFLGGLVVQPIYFIWDAAERADRARRAEDAKILRVLDLYGRSILSLIEGGLSTPADSEAAGVHKQRLQAQVSLDKFGRELIDRRSRLHTAEEPSPAVETLREALRLSLNPGYCLVCIGLALLIVDARRSSDAKMG